MGQILVTILNIVWLPRLVKVPATVGDSKTSIIKSCNPNQIYKRSEKLLVNLFLNFIIHNMSQMAILLRRSSACLIGSGSQFFYRYLSAAANPSHTIIPTSVSSARRFSSSSPLNSNEPTVGDNIHQPSTDQQTISEIFAEIQSVRKEIKSIREKREGKKEPPIEEVVVVKEKHPLLKNIELEMSKSEELKREVG